MVKVGEIMINAFFVLGIEPTTDKSIIQKAYADLLKTYHPEDQPDEFLRIQKAYKNAMNYAKSRKNEEKFIRKEGVEHAKPIRIPQTEETEKSIEPEVWPEVEEKPRIRIRQNAEPKPEQKPEPEPEVESKPEQLLENENASDNNAKNIPDYIHDISQNVKYQSSSNYKKISSYIEYISERIWEKKSENGDKEIESLFNIYEFRQIAILPEFMHMLKEKVGYISNGNLLAVQALRNNYMQLAQERPADKKLTEYVEYWGRREASIKENITKEKRKKIYGILAVPCVLLFLVFLFFNRSTYVFRDAPTTKQVSDILYDRYGVKIQPENISKVYVSKMVAPPELGRAVSYEAVYKDGELEIPFHCVYTLNMESPEELQSNLERAVFQEYYFKYLSDAYIIEYEQDISDDRAFRMDMNCGKCHNASVYDSLDNEIHCELGINNSSAAEEFVQNYINFADAFFTDDFVRKTDRKYIFNIYGSTEPITDMDDYYPVLVFTLDADNYRQVLKDLPKNASAPKYDAEEVVDKLLEEYY